MDPAPPPPSPRAPAPADPARAAAVEVLGVPVHPLRLAQLLEEVGAAAAAGRRLTVMYANVHVVNTSVRVPALRQALRRADLVYCDGAGVRLGARLLGRALPPRMTGADLLWDLAAMAERRGLRLAWVGGAPGVAQAALERLRERHPGLVVAGGHHGFFAGEPGGTEALLAALRRDRPDLLLVGLGSPAQELWVERHREALAAPVVWCIGAGADFVAGRVRRAPAWMRGAGLEWLFRFLLEPRRLLGRYLLGNPLFLARVLGQRLGLRRAPP